MEALVPTRAAALVAIAFATVSGVVGASSTSCGGGHPGGGGGHGGAGGGGGGVSCPEEVAPLFTLRVTAHEDALPADLELAVSWSAGDEPTVSLGDESTYGTSEDNVVCARVHPFAGQGGVDADETAGGAGGAGATDTLVCELWTSGPTRVRLAAEGFMPFDDTLAPATLDGCERPVPSEVEIEIVAEQPPDGS